MNRKVILTLVIVLALIAGATGIGFAAFRAGTAYGLSQSEAVAAAIRDNRPGIDGGPGGPLMPGAYGFAMPHSYGVGDMHGSFRGGFGHGGFGFGLGFLQCLIPLFGLLLLFAAFRFFFQPWGWRRGWGGHGPWGHGGPNGEHLPPMFEEWHKRAHGQTPPAPPPANNPPATNAE